MRASYPTYKSTAISWLPEMPEHWDLIGLNLLFRDNKNKNKGMVESLILSLSYGNIIRKQKEENYGLIPESFETYQIVEPGYIVLRLTDLQNDKRSLRVGYVKEKGIITSAYTGLVPGKVDSKYYYYLLHYLDIRKHFYSLGGGVRQSSDYNEIKKTKVPLPPLPEQTVIANYLDAKSEQINRFIEKKEKLIALLKEKKQSIRAEIIKEYSMGVTHVRIKSVISNVTSGVWGDDPQNNDDDTVCVRVADFDENNYGISNQNLTIRNISSTDRRKRLLNEGDLLIEKSGGGDNSPVGRVVIYNLNMPALCSNFISKIKLRKGTNNEYVYHLFAWLYSERQNIQAINATTGIQNIDLHKYFQCKVPIPDFSKQLEISSRISNELYRIDFAINRIKSEIKKVKELKQSLIAEVVTGKIRVA